ncbi:hypothetical protein JD844_013490 [Phrynosoma platyrhinos]|uniref:F-box and leucine-rich repeat protein 2 n=1 Tax=Phrynosoma platyrhinos TaxID=52577 RepID=A0ABQ7TLV7_PHRPL|nr:hypothetical protein JD844_013490 [Phrynosoma platyrhinos]
MPKKKTLQSLKRLCLEYVADNMEHTWAKDYMENNQNENNSLNMLAPSPFIKLDDFLIQELFQLLRYKGYRSSAMIYSLLVPQLTKLDLSYHTYTASESIAQVITVRCRSLTSLDLNSCSQISTDTLVDLVKALPGLLELNLSETQCDTQVLSTVGSFCTQLYRLEIMECKRLSAYSLLCLAYDPVSGFLRCQMLENLRIGPWGPGNNRWNLLWAIVFVLLALPNLRSFPHYLLTEALCVIHDQHLDAAEMPLGFPSLIDLAWFRINNAPNNERNRLTLGLLSVINVDEYFWPTAHAVCPHIVSMSVTLTGRPGLDQRFWSCHHLVFLEIDCMDCMDMRELLPVVTSLESQLIFLTVRGFSFIDEFSFHALLSRCMNLQKLNIKFCSPQMCEFHVGTNLEALVWDFSLPPLEFPHLCAFTLSYKDWNNPLPSQHKVRLKECLESLLKCSPWLFDLELAFLPFNLDEVFARVLEPPGTALQGLRQLSLAGSYVTISAIHRLLSSDNELSHLMCMSTGIHSREFEELLQRVEREGLEILVEWV